ncbi:MAG: GNAT family N-acetyltransferase [Actinomycetota bacterium]
MTTGTRGSPSKLLLRDVREEDLPVFFEHQRDHDANEMAAFPARDRDAHMAHWARILADETVAKKTIVSDDEVAGNIVGWIQDGRREIGYWVGKAHWGRGIATEAVRQFLVDVSERPLYASVAKHNLGSIRVLQKCGFAIRSEPGAAPTPADGIEEVLLELRS